MFIADAHCDALYRMVTGSSPRSTTPETLKQGGVGVQALAMFAGEDEDRGFHRARPLCEALAAFGLPVLTGDMPKTPPTAPHAVATVEGGELFEGDLDKLRALDADVRVRMIALTWNFENELGFPAMGGSKNGLKPRGREFLAEMAVCACWRTFPTSTRPVSGTCASFPSCRPLPAIRTAAGCATCRAI